MKDKEKRGWIFLLIILIFLIYIVDRAISRKVITSPPEIEQGWDKTLKDKSGGILTAIRQFRFPRISIAVHPLSHIYFFALNRGLPEWFAIILAYIPLPVIIAVLSFSLGKRQWQKIRGRMILKGLTIGIFFLFTIFIIYKGLRRQFDELFFLFTIAIFIPATLGALLTEKSAQRQF